jgi:hypothetical protein
MLVVIFLPKTYQSFVEQNFQDQEIFVEMEDINADS